jgi:hypothetical protein
LTREERIIDLDAQIRKLQGVIGTLTEERNTIQIELLDEEIASTTDIEKQFFAWAKSPAPKVDNPWIVHVEASSGRELFQYDGGFIDCQRRETKTIDEVVDYFEDALDDLKDLGDDEEPSEWSRYTRNDIHDWMRELIKINFGSMIYDW